MSSAAPVESPRSIAGIVAAALLFAALAVLLDGPVWLVKLVPTQDGPVHLAQADLIARFGWGGALTEPAASFYQWNPRIEPNSAIYLLLAGLIRLTGDALMANTLFLSLYGFLWIAAAFAASRSQTGRPMLPLLLLLPLAFGVFIHWGFYNYALGVPLFLLFASFWRKATARRNAVTFIATALFLGALCLTHITAVVAACLLLAADGLARATQALDRHGIRAALGQLTADGAWAAAAALPVLLITLSFLSAYQQLPAEADGAGGGLTQILRRIMAATYLFSFTWWEVVALVPLLAALVVAGVAALRRIKTGELTWPIFFALVVLLSLLNLKTGTASLSERLAPFTWIAVVMAIASRQPGPALVRTLCAAALAGLTGQSAIRALAYQSWSATLQSELDAGRDNPGKTFASADLIAPRDSALFAWRVRPTLHAAQTAALAAHGAGLSSPLPSTRYFGYFPLQYVEARDFMRAAPDWESEPDAAALAAFQKSNRGAPHVLIVSSSDGYGAALASRLGYDDCKAGAGGARQLAVCKASPRLSVAHE
ncbi:hypothetical protein [Bradyrhizobium sp.]|jgi:hypothetical protein|uniref:hypothetical protein n=1 Tax=Bradyrhizobium sp. TaxID=376 RepID=UPI002E043C42|nr:hypothetical protein [Bradyrhizobium sp.]